MKISADTLDELQDAIDAHTKDGWVEVSRVRHTIDNSYIVILEKVEPTPEKLYQCKLCGLQTIDKNEICLTPSELPYCDQVATLMGIKEI